LSAASLIYVRTEESRRILPSSLQPKIIKFGELTIRPHFVGIPRALRTRAPKLLFAGRLLYWKGVDIVIDAFYHIIQQQPKACLTIVGQGPEQDRIKGEIERRGLAGSVRLLSQVPQEELFALYDSHNIFVFPSLHD